jgi:uncharacterized Zn-binding protein involved in type VI secretion
MSDTKNTKNDKTPVGPNGEPIVRPEEKNTPVSAKGEPIVRPQGEPIVRP